MATEDLGAKIFSLHPKRACLILLLNYNKVSLNGFEPSISNSSSLLPTYLTYLVYLGILFQTLLLCCAASWQNCLLCFHVAWCSSLLLPSAIFSAFFWTYHVGVRYMIKVVVTIDALSLYLNNFPHDDEDAN